MTFRADLHCHTSCSDGTMTPTEIILHAQEIGLKGLSITDHDNVKAYPEAIFAAKKAKIWLGTGVEFSSVHKNRNVHILGYDFDHTHSDLLIFCQRHIDRRRARNREIIAKLAKHNMKVDEQFLDDLLDRGVPVGRPHIALQLVELGYVENVENAFDLYLGDGKSCYDPGSPISSAETIELIHTAKGKAFLAHPHLLKSNSTIQSLLQLPFDGIECYYSRLPSEKEVKWVRLAEERNLLKSGGSDFHGMIKPSIPLGCSWVNEIGFNEIFENYRWKT